MKKSLIISIIMLTMTIFADYAVSAPAATAKPAQQTAVTYTTVSPLDVVNNPNKYLNKNIAFNAEFVAFTALGLDYKPALRSGSDYIGILIRRPDVTDHTIPLSEMKIFLKRDLAEKYIDLDSGDKIKIEGKVFSTALSDPWVDITKFTVLTQKPKTDKK